MNDKVAVYYRGSQKDHHGMYWTEWSYYDDEAQRYSLYQKPTDKGPWLTNVRRQSYDLLIIVAQDGTIMDVRYE